MDKWLYAIDGKQEGPVEETQIATLLREGKLTSESLIWKAGQPTWLPISKQLPGLISPAAAPAAPIAPIPPAVPTPPAAPSFPSQPAFPAQPAFGQPAYQAAPRKSSGWVKFLIIAIILVVLVVVAIIAGLIGLGLWANAQKKTISENVVPYTTHEQTTPPAATPAPEPAAPSGPGAAATSDVGPVVTDAAVLQMLKTANIPAQFLVMNVGPYTLDLEVAKLNVVDGLKIMRATYRNGDAGATTLQFLNAGTHEAAEQGAHDAVLTASGKEPSVGGDDPKFYQGTTKAGKPFIAWALGEYIFTSALTDDSVGDTFVTPYFQKVLWPLLGSSAPAATSPQTSAPAAAPAAAGTLTGPQDKKIGRFSRITQNSQTLKNGIVLTTATYAQGMGGENITTQVYKKSPVPVADLLETIAAAFNDDSPKIEKDSRFGVEMTALVFPAKKKVFVLWVSGSSLLTVEGPTDTQEANDFLKQLSAANGDSLVLPGT